MVANPAPHAQHCRTGLSSSCRGESRCHTRGLQGTIWMAQSAPFAGDILCRQRGGAVGKSNSPSGTLDH